jgi:hypothetical protein
MTGFEDWMRIARKSCTIFCDSAIVTAEIRDYRSQTGRNIQSTINQILKVGSIIKIYDPLKIADEIVTQCVRKSPDELKICEDMLVFVANTACLAL